MSDQPNDERAEQQTERDERDAKAATDKATAERATITRNKAAADAKAKADAATKAETDAAAKATADEAAARRDASRGAQVVLDPESDAALAAKGALAPTIEENTQARDAALIDMGLHPNAPSGHLTDPQPLPVKPEA